MNVPFYTADVFTNRQFGGNPLAVIPDARGLDARQMQAIATEFNLSETAFVFPPDDPAHTRKVRIFTPAAEIPFAGHPTVGTAHVLASIGEIEGEVETRIVLEEQVGPVPVTIRWHEGAPVFCQLSVAQLPIVGPRPPTRSAIAEMLSLDVQDLVTGSNVIEAVSCGMPFLFVPVRDRDAVARARVRLDLWEEKFKNYWAPQIMVFSRDPELERSDIRARVFVPGLSVPEDPATGSCAAALGGYLGARDDMQSGKLTYRVEQGFEMGRPSLLDIEVDKREGRIVGIRVGGESVLVSRGELLL